MGITKRDLEQVYKECGSKYGGIIEDYFALLYLASKFNRKITDIAHQVAFGGNDYGIDAFYIDKELRNLYLFQFKWSENHHLFRDSFERLIDKGFERIFGNPLQDQNQNQLILQVKSALNENQAIIDRVIVYFVFNGDPESAERSAVLDSLREDLESKKYLIDQYFDRRQVTLTFQYLSNDSKKVAGISFSKKTHKYSITLNKTISITSPNGEELHIGLISLSDLYDMYSEMGYRLFERNIRFGLSPEKSPNRAIRKTLQNIILKNEATPEIFTFNHNGISLFTEKLEFKENTVTITEPRILNGAQTIASLDKFIKDNESNLTFKNNKHLLKAIFVTAKIISNASKKFITSVTICNNKQNPVEPWNLRASDSIQLAFQDKFRDDLGIFYERQENSFESHSDEDLEEMGIKQNKAVEIKRLAQTFLAFQGEVDKMSRLREVFETDSIYQNTFQKKYLNEGNSRKILLIYKIQFRLNKIIWGIYLTDVTTICCIFSVLTSAHTCYILG